MNGTDVLKVYLVQSKKYAYCLHFTRVIAPEWVRDALNAIDLGATIGFKEEADEDLQDLIMHNMEDTNDEFNMREVIDVDNDDEVEIFWGDDKKLSLPNQSNQLRRCGMKIILNRRRLKKTMVKV
jgi:hypothetical protein